MSTPKSIQQILAWQAAHAGDVPYSEEAGTRLAYDSAHLTSATDCSGMAARMFRHFAGINPGTYTGNECNYGQLVTTSRSHAAAGEGMLPGDVILFDWNGGGWDHIAIYAGNGRIWNHGGPGRGPLNWSLAGNVNAAVKVMVRRWVQPAQPAPGPTHPAWPFSSHDTTDLLGNVDNPSNHVHGGLPGVDSDAVIAAVWAVKQKLHALGFGGMDMTSKEWGGGMDDALVAYRKKYKWDPQGSKTIGHVGYYHILNQKK